MAVRNYSHKLCLQPPVRMNSVLYFHICSHWSEDQSAYSTHSAPDITGAAKTRTSTCSILLPLLTFWWLDMFPSSLPILGFLWSWDASHFSLVFKPYRLLQQMAAVSRCITKGTFRFSISWRPLPGSQIYNTWLKKWGANRRISRDAAQQESFCTGFAWPGVGSGRGPMGMASVRSC